MVQTPYSQLDEALNDIGWHISILDDLGVFMEPVPVVNYGIRQTAENMIEEHGPQALAEAKTQAQIAEL